MDTAVALVSAYLQLNGYFVQTEVPVVERSHDDPPRFQQTTDIDVLAVRFPASAHRRPPRESQRWAGLVSVDPVLEAPREQTDVIIGEVKEGSAKLNPNLTKRTVLEAALWRTGGCMSQDLEGVSEGLRRTGEATAVHCDGGVQRFRLVAFGGRTSEEEPEGYSVVSLEAVVAFLWRTIRENSEVFKVVDFKDPVLGMMLLRQKVGV